MAQKDQLIYAHQAMKKISSKVVLQWVNINFFEVLSSRDILDNYFNSFLAERRKKKAPISALKDEYIIYIIKVPLTFWITG